MTGVTLYSEMAPDVASAARAAAERIRVHMSRAAADIIAIGTDLIEIKSCIGHGNFQPWIQAEFGMSSASARRFMQVAERFSDKNVTVTHLPPTVLYALAAPSTPEPVREEAMRRVEAGEPVDMDVVADLKRQVCDARQLAKDAKRDEKVQKDLARRAQEDRHQILKEMERWKAQAEAQAREIVLLKEDGVIHVYPQETAAPPARSPSSGDGAASEEPTLIRTAAELIADRFDHDVVELASLLREARQFSLAAEIEAVVSTPRRIPPPPHSAPRFIALPRPDSARPSECPCAGRAHPSSTPGDADAGADPRSAIARGSSRPASVRFHAVRLRARSRAPRS